jgi:hypothetical protein
LKSKVDIQDSVSGFYSWKHFLVAMSVSLAYLSVSYILLGFKQDQLVLSVIFTTLYLLTPATRKFILGFSIFIVYWIIYDYMKAFPNFQFNEVHIKSLYNAEASFFGIQDAGGIVTPNEYWLTHKSVFLDVLCGCFYLCWIPVPLGFATFLFFYNREIFLRFSLTFLFVNLLGFVVYYLYPAAPPWYIQTFGEHFNAATPGNIAGLSGFDRYFDVTIFKSLYAKGSNVFAAMPSLHSAYPLIVSYFALKARIGLASIFFVIVTLGIWFAAVYTSHHYVLDVLAGILCASVGISWFEWMANRAVPVRTFLSKYLQAIS